MESTLDEMNLWSEDEDVPSDNGVGSKSRRKASVQRKVVRSSETSMATSPAPISANVAAFLGCTVSTFWDGLECNVCRRSFQNQTQLFLHAALAHALPFCPACARLFVSAAERDSHLAMCSEALHCSLCSHLAATPDLLAMHLLQSHGCVPCTLCGVELKGRNEQEEHASHFHQSGAMMSWTETVLQQTSALGGGETLLCLLCNEAQDVSRVCDHLLGLHRLSLGQLALLLTNSPSPLPLSWLARGKPLPLDGSAGSTDLVNGVDEVTEGNEVEDSGRNNSIVLVKEEEEEEGGICLECGAQYSAEVPSEVHRVLCRGEVFCGHCQALFQTQEDLVCHVTSEHAFFACCYCSEGGELPSESALCYHLSSQHDLEPCPWCGLEVGQVDLCSHLSGEHRCGSSSLLLSPLPSSLQPNSEAEPSLSRPAVTPSSSNQTTAPTTTQSESCTLLTEAVLGSDRHLLCGLCGEDLVLELGSSGVESVFRHFLEVHHISWSRALKWMGSAHHQQLWRSFWMPLLPGKMEDNMEKKRWKVEGLACEQEGECDEEEEEKEELLQQPLVDVKVEVEEADSPSEERMVEVSIPNNCQWSSSEDGDKLLEDEREEEDKEEEFSWDPELNPLTVECVANTSSSSEGEDEVEDGGEECEMCAERQPSRHCLLVHLDSAHGFAHRSLPSTCPCCQKSYGHPAHLKEHVDTAHPGEEGEKSGFHCPFCLVRMDKRRAMRRHLAEVHEETHLAEELAYQCRFCLQLFWEVAQWDRHVVQAHPDKMKDFLKCSLCPTFFAAKHCLRSHIGLHHPESELQLTGGVSFKCRSCLSVLPSLRLMHEHASQVHASALLLRCCTCGELLRSRALWKEHLRTVHLSPNEEGHECEECGQTFGSHKAHMVHRRAKHTKRGSGSSGLGCRLCPLRFASKEERQNHYQSQHQGEEPYRCSLCGKGFASKSGMYGHRQLHTGTGKSTCQFCGKEFTRRDSYNEHLLIHVGPRHKCGYCAKEFVQRSNLVRHVRIHTGEKPYKCTFCDKCFSDKGACNSHIRVHTREEVCSCPYCGQTFSKKQKLKYHIRKHTGEDLVICDICGKAFTNSFAMKEHRQTHNQSAQVNCLQCERTFTTEKNLRRHVYLVHQHKSQLQCSICKKRFVTPGRLKTHELSHLGLKQVQCRLCGKAYSERKSMRRHLWRCHHLTPNDPRAKEAILSLETSTTLLPSPLLPSGEGDSPSSVLDTTSSPGVERKRKKTMEQVLRNLQKMKKTGAEEREEEEEEAAAPARASRATRRKRRASKVKASS